MHLIAQIDSGLLPAIARKSPEPSGIKRAGMELAGLEPATSWVRSRRSPKLSYSPGELPIIDSAPGPLPASGVHCRAAGALTLAPARHSASGTPSMGSLDDAIREHLELKRQRGATDDEVKRQEEEAFGRGRRPAPDAGSGRRARRRPARVDDPLAPDELEAAEPQSNGQPAEHQEPPPAFEPEPFEPDEVPAEESLAARDDRAGRADETAEWDETGEPRGPGVGRPARGDAGVPRGVARGGQALVRAASSEGLRPGLGKGRRMCRPLHCVRAAPLRGAHLSRSFLPVSLPRGPEFPFRQPLFRPAVRAA